MRRLISTLKAFFMKSYRKKFPEAPLSKLSDEEVDMAVKDDSMFMFSKKVVPDSAIVKETFHDRQDVWAMGPADWQAMENELKMYRKTIVRALAHCHKSSTDSWEEIVPVTSSRQLAPTNSYVILTGWYKMQCCIVKPHMTIADLKCYLHEKNGARMPLECIDIGVRSGDDIRIVDDALTLEQVYVRAMAPGEPDFGTGPGTLVDIEKEEKEAAEKAEELRRAEEEIEANKDKRGLGAGDKTYFKRHETTSRVHADWDNEDSELKTYSIDDQVHLKGGEGESGDLIGPQMPMYLRTTHKPRESKYAHLTADGETTAYLTKEGDYAERPTIKSKDVEAARRRRRRRRQGRWHRLQSRRCRRVRVMIRIIVLWILRTRRRRRRCPASSRRRRQQRSRRSGPPCRCPSRRPQRRPPPQTGRRRAGGQPAHGQDARAGRGQAHPRRQAQDLGGDGARPVLVQRAGGQGGGRRQQGLDGSADEWRAKGVVGAARGAGGGE